MASLGKVGNKELRVACCLVEMQGVAAVPISDVAQLVREHYDKVKYSGYSEADMTAELEANKKQRKCVAFLPVNIKSGATFITGQSKAQGGYEAKAVGTG